MATRMQPAGLDLGGSSRTRCRGIDQALSLRDDQANDAIHVLVDCEA